MKEKLKFQYNTICNRFRGKSTYDEWGIAYYWRGNRGVEYNLCKDKGVDTSAWYWTVRTTEGIVENDGSKFVPYRIDFSCDDWEERLFQSAVVAWEELWGEYRLK